MSSAPAPEDLARNARWLVQALDPVNQMVRVVAMDSEAYRQASFLDDRMFQQSVEAHVLPWATVRDATGHSRRRDARWIFHIGHVGSTLLARLLGELDGVLSVREPRFLRDLMTLESAARASFADAAAPIYSRAFGPSETAVVKATSFVSEAALELVPPGERALFMFARPEAYIAGILAGEASVQELQHLAPVRAARIARRVDGFDAPRSLADLAAIAWATEMTSLEAAGEAMSDRSVAWMDFDEALAHMPAALGRAGAHFGFDAPPDDVEAIATGPLMRRYSKALEYDYSPDLRRDLLAEATTYHRADIADALAMLARAAEKSPLLARALERRQLEAVNV